MRNLGLPNTRCWYQVHSIAPSCSTRGTPPTRLQACRVISFFKGGATADAADDEAFQDTADLGSGKKRLAISTSKEAVPRKKAKVENGGKAKAKSSKRPRPPVTQEDDEIDSEDEYQLKGPPAKKAKVQPPNILKQNSYGYIIASVYYCTHSEYYYAL